MTSLLNMIRLYLYYPFGYMVSTYSEKKKQNQIKLSRINCNQSYNLILLLTVQNSESYESKDEQ